MVRAFVSILYYAVVLVWSIAYFCFILVLFLSTVLFDPERVVLHKASWFWAMSIFALNPFCKLKIVGREHIAPGGVYVVTVNHQSMIDIPLMYALPKLNFKWVAKSGVYKWPLFGVVLWLHGDITVDEKGSVKKAKGFISKGVEHLKRGTSVTMFPEGTRSRDGEIHNFKEGAFLLAKEAGVQILPCVIDGCQTITKGWRLAPNTFYVRITPPVPAATVQATATRELMGIVRERTIKTLAEVREEESKKCKSR